MRILSERERKQLMMFLKICVKKFKEFWMKVKLINELLKGGLEMAVIYATLIIKGYKKFSDVPNSLKDKVREILEQLECSDLIDD